MAETRAIHDLYAIMSDGTAGIRNRINAAVSASRVEPLAMPGESEPPVVVFLREVVACEYAGLMFRYHAGAEPACPGSSPRDQPRQRYILLPAIRTTISSRCQQLLGRGRRRNLRAIIKQFLFQEKEKSFYHCRPGIRPPVG